MAIPLTFASAPLRSSPLPVHHNAHTRARALVGRQPRRHATFNRYAYARAISALRPTHLLLSASLSQTAMRLQHISEKLEAANGMSPSVGEWAAAAGMR